MKIEVSKSYPIGTIEIMKVEQEHDNLVQKLIAKLAAGVTVFYYEKGDGSVRPTKGTTNPQFFVKKSWQIIEDAANILKSQDANPEAVKILEEHIRPQPATNRQSSADNIAYYDLEANGWRSLNANKLIGVSV
jgi:hypothetical protein